MLSLFCPYTLVTFPTYSFTYPASKLDIHIKHLILYVVPVILQFDYNVENN